MKKTVQWLIVVFTATVSSILTYYFTYRKSDAPIGAAQADSTIHQSYCGFKILRQDGYKFIQPVQFIQQECESPQLAGLKSNIIQSIDSFYRVGIAKNISYFLRNFEDGSWTSVNPEFEYHPGSLMKVPVLTTYLKMSESIPGLLDKRLLFDAPKEHVAPQLIQSKRIEFGKEYSIRELLKYMIGFSDNSATMLLLKNIDKELYVSMYKDLHMEVPDLMDFNFTMNSVQYSLFLSAVYNGSYLNDKNSEYAMELLASSDFKNGIVAGLPIGTPVAHKFGEWSDGHTASQFHEAGVIYCDDHAFMLIIMTDGADNKVLPPVITDLTKKTMDFLKNSVLSKTNTDENAKWTAGI